MCRPVICVIASFTIILAPAVSRATDPVTKLRNALRVETAKDRQEQIDFVIKNELTTISQLHRAYFLDWYAKDDATLPKFRAQISEKLVTAVDAAASDGNSDRQLAVAILIAEIAESDAAKPLVKDKLDREPKIKFLREFTPAVQKLAEQKDPTIRQAALHALGRITPAPAEAYKTLKQALKGDEVGPRRLAAYANLDLVKNARLLSRPEAIDTLEQGIRTAADALKDADEMVRGYSLQVIQESATTVADLFYQKESVVDDDKKALNDDLQKLFKAMQAANPRLLDAVNDGHLKIRLAGTQALVQLGEMRAKVMATLDKPEAKRSEIWKSFDAVDPLAGVIAKLDEKISPLLWEEDVRLRRGGADFLEFLGAQAEPAARGLTQALRDSDRFVRLSATRAFRNLPAAKIGDAIRTLGVLVTDPDGDISRSAAEALETLGPDASAKGAPVGDFQKAVHYLGLITAKQYTDNRPPDTETRLAAMRALVGIGGRATDPLSKKTTPLAELAIPHLLTALFDEDVRIRRAAAETLGRIGRPGDADLVELERQALQRALRDEDAEVRLNAASALVDIAPSKKPL